MTSNPFDGHSTLWVMHISHAEGMAERAQAEGFICIGWSAMGDLNQYPTRDAMRDALARQWPECSDASVRSQYGQLFRFAHEMKVGDPVVLTISSSREVLIGRIVGGYEFKEPGSEWYKLDCSNFRKVEWLGAFPRTRFSQAALRSFGSFSSVSTSDDHLEEVTQVLRSPEPVASDTAEQVGPEPAVDDFQEIEGTDLHDLARQETEDYLLKSWRRTGAHFEHVVAAVLSAMGYTTTVTEASGDHGIDVIAHPDALGLERPYIKVQVKSGTSTVGEPVVNQLKGGLNAGEQGLVVSLGPFSKQALAVERSASNVTLVGATRFVELFLAHYGQLEPAWQARYPLRSVFVPAPKP